jgi:SAM-dependent MidA family methyltransferase
MGVDRYMDLCLNDPQDGYYGAHPRLGAEGDFITAPHVSQMFGELLGLWAAEVWDALGRPASARLVEIGPGDGVMMSDVLRAARAAAGFLACADVWLVETSAPLVAIQAQRLAGAGNTRWAGALEEIPGGAPLIVLANEVLDCLPIRQAVATDQAWRERRIDLGTDGRLTFVIGEPVEPPGAPAPVSSGAVFEWSAAAAAFGRSVGERVLRDGGAALFIDYGSGEPAIGDTLQALEAHCRRDPLQEPGRADLTAHADFAAFAAAARAAGAAVTRLVPQADFLKALGIELRADTLARARPDRADTILRQLRRLTGADQMGQLFKVLAVHTPGLAVPGLESAP